MGIEKPTPSIDAQPVAVAAARNLRRSLLITPGDDERLIPKAATCAADVTILDWEDGVFESRKSIARHITKKAFAELDWGHRERVVRINPLNTRYADEDISAAVAAGANAIMLSKIYSASDIRDASRKIKEAESGSRRQPGSVLIWVMIETVQALMNVEEIACADLRMTALLFGGGDLGADLQVKRLSLGANRQFGPIRYEYLYGSSKVITAARAAKIDPCNMGYTTFTDLEGTKYDAEFAAQLGFTGGLALSIRQLSVINEAFSPSAADLEWADAILKDFENANQAERTVIVVQKEMADGPYIRSARHIRDLQNRIRARDAKSVASA